MAAIFDTIITQGVRSGQIPARTQGARDWFRETAEKIRTVNERSLMKGDQSRLTSTPLLVRCTCLAMIQSGKMSYHTTTDSHWSFRFVKFQADSMVLICTTFHHNFEQD